MEGGHIGPPLQRKTNNLSINKTELKPEKPELVQSSIRIIYETLTLQNSEKDTYLFSTNTSEVL